MQLIDDHVDVVSIDLPVSQMLSHYDNTVETSSLLALLLHQEFVTGD